MLIKWLQALRWLRRAHIDTNMQPTTYLPTPLCISTFTPRTSPPGTATPLMWGATSWELCWVKRHSKPATLPGFEAADQLVLDLRESFGMLVGQGRLKFPITTGV